ncbi:MAG: putative TonB-dependent receptor [Acidobacteria bacterium]|nr:putative TonB-dependent receptor [Acidobacteriota bacterium]
MIAALIFALAASVSGIVHDSSGGVVSGAAVVVRAGSGADVRVTTGPDGRFAVETAATGTVTVTVLAGGFAEKVERVTDPSRPLDITLAPAGLLETVTVTPGRSEQRLGDVPASVSVMTSAEIRQSPAVVADDVLRQIPTFSLFRRTSSLSSHPTAQGVSLRGIGPSGVSRTLVLVDGTPFNDPFGGWVYWTRVPLESVDRIEVVDGSSSSLYGNYAMGGVINIVSAHPARRSFDFKPQYGNHQSPKVDYTASDVWGKLGITTDGSIFDTDGFPIVTSSERGLIDINATVKFRNFNGKMEFTPTDRVSVFARAGYFGEDRVNGKVGEVNDTRWKSASGGLRLRLPDESDLQASVYSDFENFHSTFLAVTAPSATVAARSIVRLTVDQQVPTTGVGGMVQWAKALGAKNYLSAGTDWHYVDGDSDEASFNAAPGVVTPPTQNAILAFNRVSGGTQNSMGAFVQDILTPLPKLSMTLSARLDHWRNYDAHNLETPVIAGTVVNNVPSCGVSAGVPPACLPDRTDTVVSPRAAARYQLTDWISVWGDLGTGFRAPTLNELYRQFRVGTVLTTANANLGPERLVGGEAGVSLAPTRDVTLRFTWYDNRVTNPVSNVTLTTVGATVTQQRQNLGATRIQGLQSDAEYRVGSFLRFAAGYLYNDAKVTDGGAANASLVGKFLPQVPKHRGSVRAAYFNPKFASVAFSVQFFGAQFDDDQNVRAVPAAALAELGYSVSATPGLPGYTVADLSVSRTFGRYLEAFAGVQNLFDQAYIVGTLPTTIGSPRLVNGGVRVRFSGR